LKDHIEILITLGIKFFNTYNLWNYIFLFSHLIIQIHETTRQI